MAAPVLETPAATEKKRAVAPDFMSIYRGMTTPRLISEAWATEEDPVVRDRILTTLVGRTAAEGEAATWPSAEMRAREVEAGLYPNVADPQFAARLFSKREFYEARAVAAGVAEGTVDPCTSTTAERVFELTPVQRIVSRFLNPATPYNGMLLYHGVGVGKTCSAVTIAEQFLEAAPTSKVIVLVPQALQDNFKRTVFDAGKLVWDEEAGSWTARQCTGVSYLERLGLTDERDLRVVQYRVEKDIRSRYTVTGYQAFANWLERTLAKRIPGTGLTPAARRVAENDVLRTLFSDHLIIVDEAHNLRDTAAAEADGEESDEVAGDGEAAGGAAEAAENKAGKALNPYLQRIVLNAEGLRLVLMTATPMYNAAPEIVLLLNYLLMNYTKTTTRNLDASKLFDRNGALIEGSKYLPLLERAARSFVSYMRGENPWTFPLRMRPEAAVADPIAEWPAISATRKPVELDGVADALRALPLVITEPVAGSPVDRLLRGATVRTRPTEAPVSLNSDSEAETEEAESEEAAMIGKERDTMLELRMQMANMSYPNMLYGTLGWDNYMTGQDLVSGKRRVRVFVPRAQPEGPFDVDTVFRGEALRLHAPKIHRVVESVRRADGICFVYSRSIKSGALPMAVALERAGFQRRLADGRIVPLLTGVPPVAPVCALCGEAHGGDAADHPFRPACYVLLTSDDKLSPNFPGLVQTAATWPGDAEWGAEGGWVKVVIGSQVASEGLDLKCVREIHVLDPWYHLNRTDQIIGRGIRYCSHSALRAVERRRGLPPLALNNTLIYLHAVRGGADTTSGTFESADLYAYRIAIAKAQRVGRVQRLLKQHAWDCALEIEALSFMGLPKRRQLDAQRRPLDEYSIDDQDYTSTCDYQRCRYECAVSVARTVEEGLELDMSTFGINDARRLILMKQEAVRRLFADQVMVPESLVQELFSDLPWEVASEALMELLDGRRFRLTRSDGTEGFIIKKAGWLVFQPAAVRDPDTPLALRYARAFQLRRRFMVPATSVFGAEERREAGGVKKVIAAAAAAPVLAPAAAAGAGEITESDAAAPTPTAALERWAAWYNFVVSGGPLPAGIHPIWRWLMARFGALPATTDAALRWYLDRAFNYTDLRALYEFAAAQSAAESGPVGGLVATLDRQIFRSDRVLAYRIYNPATLAVEIWCRMKGAESFGKCLSSYEGAIDKALGDTPVRIPADTGTLVGFMAGKKGALVFKTLDTTKEKKRSTVGAECGNTSNLGEHHPRIRLLHEAGRAAGGGLGALMLPDDDASWDAAGAPIRMRDLEIAHMRDITHQPLCIYMEFLTRLLDTVRVEERRWFLDAVTAARAGLKGRA